MSSFPDPNATAHLRPPIFQVDLSSPTNNKPTDNPYSNGGQDDAFDSRSFDDRSSANTVVDTREKKPTTWELEEADKRPFGMMHLFKTPGKKPSPWTLAILAVFAIIGILLLALHDKIVNAIKPSAEKLENLPAGWLIPIAILIILSFPPLFGHEIVQLLCGIVWGTWKGFLIAAAGTLLGEIALWFAFKQWCTRHVEKIERDRLIYACMGRVVRDGGFKVVLILRYSAVPPHFTTALFSSCGVSFWAYLAAAFLSLPKQFATVYLGVVAAQPKESKANKILSAVVIAITILVTVISMKWIFKRMDSARPLVIAERRNKTMEEGGSYGGGFSAENNGGLYGPRPGHARNASGEALISGAALPGVHVDQGHEYDDERPRFGSGSGYSPMPMTYPPPSEPPPPQRSY